MKTAQSPLDKSLLKDIKVEVQKSREQLAALIGSKTPHDDAVQPTNGEVLQEILGALSELSDRITKLSAEKQIMDVLWFPELQLRFGSIDEAHRGTYRWLLHDPDADLAQAALGYSETRFDVSEDSINARKPPVDQATRNNSSNDTAENSGRNTTASSSESMREKLQRQSWREQFAEWLRYKEDFFYISGKAGSGKSTFMKCISQDPMTQQLLEAWTSADGKDLLLIHHFFWNSGTEDQRSIKGLYRSILWQVLRSRPHLTQQIFPTLWQKACKVPIHESDLGLTGLQAAFKNLLSNPQILGQNKMCFFIDGLDECEEDHWRLANDLKRWCSVPGVKLCVSGRPYNEFLAAFATDPTRWLRLHDLTRDDILRVVHDQFASDERFTQARHLSEFQTEYDRLAELIVQKADGVFIWVTLVIRSLLTGIGNYYSLSQLHKRLDAVPAEINSMFNYMMSGIDRLERQAAARTLLVMKTLDTMESPKMWVYVHAVLDSIADRPEYETNLLDGRLQQNLGSKDGTLGCVPMAHRLNGRCRGLVQILYTGRNFPYCHQLQFVHRTFSDFLDEPITVRELEAMAGTFCPYRGVALGLLSAVKHVPEQEWQLPCREYQSTKAFGDTTDRHQHENGFGGPSSMLDLLLDMAAASELTDSCLVTGEIQSLKQMTLEFLTSKGERLERPARSALITWWITASTPNEFETAALCMAAAYGAFEYTKTMIRNQTRDTGASSLLLFSSSAALRSGYRRATSEKVMAMKRFLLEQRASSNFEVRNVCFLQVDTNHAAGSDVRAYLPSPPWTPWAMSLMVISELKFLFQDYTDPKWKPLLELYLEHGADQTVCFVGYQLSKTKQAPQWNRLGFNQIFRNEGDGLYGNIEGPFYADLQTMLEIWGLEVALPAENSLSRRFTASWESLSSWLSALAPVTGQFQRVTSTEVQRWNFLVLKVVSHRKLKELRQSELEEALRQMISQAMKRF